MVGKLLESCVLVWCKRPSDLRSSKRYERRRHDLKSLLDAENFGAIDADNDQLLADTFEDHDAFIDLVKMKKFLIVGKKGSGKTAIFKRMITPAEWGDPET